MHNSSTKKSITKKTPLRTPARHARSESSSPAERTPRFDSPTSPANSFAEEIAGFNRTYTGAFQLVSNSKVGPEALDERDLLKEAWHILAEQTRIILKCFIDKGNELREAVINASKTKTNTLSLEDEKFRALSAINQKYGIFKSIEALEHEMDFFQMPNAVNWNKLLEKGTSKVGEMISSWEGYPPFEVHQFTYLGKLNGVLKGLKHACRSIIDGLFNDNIILTVKRELIESIIDDLPAERAHVVDIQCAVFKYLLKTHTQKNIAAILKPVQSHNIL